MRAVDIIQKKRDGGALGQGEIDFFVAGMTCGSLPDYQTAALLMAIVLRGMTDEETAWLTDAMVRSGERLDLSDIPGAKVDKHSTGGVGDKTSLVLAPLVAACGAIVPMMSGRGLGHAGGTLDKLEAIPGFRTNLSVTELRACLADIGCALIGQTAEIAPADKTLYALRDVTGTVESIPLIAASIMSKKIAEGIGALVLDVKTGRGAYMKTEADSRRLAESLVSIGNAAGVHTEAFITNMSAPLGRAVGNTLEVIECLETLKGRGPDDLERLSVILAARMLMLAGVAGSEDDAERRVRTAMTSGAGLEKFRQVIVRQGGDARVVDDYRRLPMSPRRHAVTSPRAGYVSALDAELVGRASMMLGAGRDRVDAVIDSGAGVLVQARPGDHVEKGQPILELVYADGVNIDAARHLAGRAIQISEQRPMVEPLVLATVSRSDTGRLPVTADGRHAPRESQVRTDG